MINYKDYKGYQGADTAEICNDLRASNGVQLTEALFEEVIQPASRKKFIPLYSLKEYENKGKPSAYQIYIHSVDETDAALKLVGSMSHWRKLCSLEWFIKGRPEAGFDGLAKWRMDMAARDRMSAKKALMIEAEGGNVSAARALDKMASDDLKNATKAAPKKTKSDVDDGLEFLYEYRGK